MEAVCARTCRPERPREWRSIEVPAPNPERDEWATARSRQTPAETGAHSAAFETAARRGCRATMDIRASAQPGAEAPRAGEDSAGVAEVADSAGAVEEAEVVAAAVEVVADTAAGADTDRSEGKPCQERMQFI